MNDQLSLEELRWMIRHWRRTMGLQRTLRRWREAFWAWRHFWHSYHRYVQLMASTGEYPSLLDYLYPCLGEDTATTDIEPIYFYQDAWAFEHIVKQHPEFHVDVGSHHKFVALLSKVVPVTMVDIRPLSLPLDTLSFRQGSILELPFEDGSLPSVSSLCVVEHIGLGRYGDPLDPCGTEKAIRELMRVLASDGRLYLSMPVGDRNVIAFNAGRVFALDYLLELLSPLVIVEQKFIVGKVLQDTYQHRPTFGTTGLFELVKPNSRERID